MLFYFWVVALLLASTIGEIRLRKAPTERYRRFIWYLAAGWALIPATTGDFVWLVASIPLAALMVPVIVSRHRTG